MDFILAKSLCQIGLISLVPDYCVTLDFKSILYTVHA